MGKARERCGSVALDDDGVPVKTELIAEFFNEFFANVGKKLADDIPSGSHDELDKFRTLAGNPLSIFFESVTAAEAELIILSMDADKSPGFDGISVSSLKCC